jgi:lipopolysaccharide heptosyltransferase II
VSAGRVAFHPICRYRRHALTARGKTEPMSTQAGPALLVAQTSFLGDVVLTTPLLSALRERLRPRRLAVLVRPEAVPLLDGHPHVDVVLADDKRGVTRGLGGLARLAARLRHERFDLAVSPHRSLRTAIVLAAARIPRRIGFAESRGAFLYHERVIRDRSLHDVQRNLALAGPFGGPAGEPRLHVAVQPAAAACAAALLPEGCGPLVGVAPGSVWATKRWTPEGFAGVLRALREQGARVVVLGAASERPIADQVVRLAGGGATVLAGRTDLATLVAVVDRLALLIANDSAPMHIACARDVPVVAVFCATTPALGYGPWGTRSAVVETDLDCRPCARHGGRACPRGTEDCMRLVRPEAVLAAARALLAMPRSAGSAA